MSLILKQQPASSIPTPPAGKGTLFLNDAGAMQVRQDDGNLASFPTVSAGDNTKVMFNDNGSIGSDSDFTFDKTTNLLTVANLTVTNTLIAGDISVSSIANGTSNVDIVGVSGNVTVSVAGNANILTVTGTGANIAGTLNASGNANVGNIGAAAGVFTTVAGSLTTASQPNITSVGTLSSLAVIGNVTSGNVYANTGTVGANIANFGNLSVTGFVTSNLIPNVDVTYDLGNSTNRWNNLYLAGNTIYLGNTSLSSGTGDALSVSDMDVSGNITAGNVYANSGTIGANLLTGTLTTNAQPNVTSVGTLSSLNVSGNANVGNLGTAQVLASANVTAPQFISNVSTGTAPFVVSSTTKVANLNADAVDGYNTSTSATADTIVVRDTNGNITGNNITGTLTTASQTNITSVGTLTSLDVTGNIGGGNLNTAGKVVASTLESNVATGTAPLTVASTTKVTNLNADLLDGYNSDTSNTANTVAVRDATGNLSATYFIGNGSQLTGIDATSIQNGNSNVKVSANGNVTISVTGISNVITVTDTGANVTGYLTVTGNITSGNANLGNLATANFVSGTLTTAAQPNITSVGALSSLSVTGNANVGNIGAAAGVFTANVSANNLSTTNKVTVGNGLQVTTGALEILAGNLDVTGNINVTGNLNYSNVTDLVVGDPLIYIGANNTGDLYDLGIVGSYNNGTYYHTGIARNAADDYWTFFDGVAAEPTTVIDWANATYPTVKLGNLIATGTANVTGNANIGNIGTTQIFATANITTVQFISNATTGTAPFTVSSTTKVANLNADTVDGYDTATAATANTIVVRNADGNITGNNISGTLSTASQTNITSVGSLTGLTVSNATGIVNFTTTANVTLGAIANLHISGGTNGQYLKTDGSGGLSFGSVSTTISITDDTSTNATYYPALTTATSGSIGAANVSSSKLYFNPSTGALAATDFNSLSDISFKTNVEPLVNGMLVVANIEAVSFNWVDTGKKAFGVIAQEIEKVIPEIVTTSADGTKTVSYDQIIPFLISAIQDLNKQIQELKNRN